MTTFIPASSASFATSSLAIPNCIHQVLPAAESAIGLAILITYYRIRGTITVDLVTLLQK